MNTRRTAGFTLVEFVIAIVFVGVVLGPFLIFVSRIHDLNSAMGQQGRREAWRSFNDQALAAGIDPTLAPGLMSAVNASVPSMPQLAVTREEVTATPGIARIVPLRVTLDNTVAETRLVGAGYQIGAGAAVAARTKPAAPLAPIVMPAPLVTPTDGAVIAANALSPANAGDPYTLEIVAAGVAGTNVSMTLNQPFITVRASDTVRYTVTALDLLNHVTGAAWAEYPGSLGSGDRSAVLADGRTRWFVTRPDGRLQIYEPSANTSFDYKIGLGTPVIARGGAENAAGATLAFDYPAFYAVQTGTVTLKVDFPAATKAALGNAWAAQSIGFQTTLHDVAGPFSGDLLSFFANDALPLWADSVVVAATPVVPGGATADAAAWTFTRTKSVLGVPLLSSTADSSGFYAPGTMQFTAPAGPDGTPLGRLSFENGTSVSTGSTLSISVTP